jgi:hypothetical protein
MKKLILLAFVLAASTSFAQEMKLPDDKKKDYVKEDKKKSNDKTTQTTATAQREDATKTVKSTGAELVNYCIVREYNDEEIKKYAVEVVSDYSALSASRDIDPMKIKELAIATEPRRYKTAIEAINTLAMQGFKLTSSNSYVTGSMAIKEYIMIKSDF